MSSKERKTILIIGTNMMNVYHHRLELIQALLKNNYEVVVAAPKGGEEKELEKIGCRFIDMPVDNRGTNIKRDLGLIKDLSRIYKEVNPDVVLTFYTKTNIYGGIVAGFKNIPYVENICGLGTSLARDNALSKIMRILYRQALRKARFVFFQNKSNQRFMEEKNIYHGAHDLLPGSGVSLKRYPVMPYPESNEVEFLFCSRILAEKGIDEYLQAASLIKKKYPNTKFHVVGPCEPEYKEKIGTLARDGEIEYHGKIQDLHPLMKRIHCSVLPSYYPEGMANILLESAASGRPIITTCLPGCGETVEDEVSGYVVKEKDYKDLADAMEKFILLSPSEKEKMGREGRKKMEREFDRDIVTHKYIRLIEDIVS